MFQVIIQIGIIAISGWFKINSVGELLWQRCFGGVGREEIYKGVVRKSDNNFGGIRHHKLWPARMMWGVCLMAVIVVLDYDFWVFEILIDDTVNIITPVVSTREDKAFPQPRHHRGLAATA